MSKVTMRRPDARAMAQLLAEQTQTAAGLILRLAWRQGLTREEIQRLTWNDVDFSAHQLRLPDRTIPLETETEDCLRRQAERPDLPTPFVVVSDPAAGGRCRRSPFPAWPEKLWTGRGWAASA